jgi:simple sugar transport system ATP-binding protein
MRNGEREGEYLVADLSRLELVNKMVGVTAVDHRKVEAGADALAAGLSADAAAQGEVFLQADGFGRRGVLSPQDLELRRGEVSALCGLLGSGRTEMARLLFGADRADSGQLRIEGRSVKLVPRDAIAAGIGFCSEDRKKEGAILELSVRENIILALQARRACSACCRASARTRSPPITSSGWASRPPTWKRRSACSPAATSRRPCWRAGWPPIRAC